MNSTFIILEPVTLHIPEMPRFKRSLSQTDGSTSSDKFNLHIDRSNHSYDLTLTLNSDLNFDTPIYVGDGFGIKQERLPAENVSKYIIYNYYQYLNDNPRLLIKFNDLTF